MAFHCREDDVTSPHSIELSYDSIQKHCTLCNKDLALTFSPIVTQALESKSLGGLERQQYHLLGESAQVITLIITD